MRLLPTISVMAISGGRAAFFCPTCGGDREAEVHDGRTRVHVGSVGVLPWRAAGTGHLRCMACGTQHRLDALDGLTSSELADLLVTATRLLTAATVRTGDPTDRELRRRAVAHVRSVVPGYHQNQLDLDMAATDPATVEQHVAPLATAMAVEGHERLLAAMVNVALGAQTISSHQRWLLDSVGGALGLTPLHITGIVTGVAAAAEPAADDPLDRS